MARSEARYEAEWEAKPMPRLVIRILGRFSLEAADHDASGIEVGKPQSLLCYLLLNRERAHLREALASALWGDGPTSTAQAKKQLRQALWNLQSALADLSVPPDLRTLIVETDWVRVNGAASLWLDAAAFEQIYLEVRDRPGESLDEQGAGRLREALAMYRGDLLEGCYEDCCCS